MRRVNFDYPDTCPSINNAIRRAKNEIENFIDDILTDACGLLDKKRREELSAAYAESLYGNLEDIFEDTRRSNEKMREEADDQIGTLKDELRDLEQRISDLESRVDA